MKERLESILENAVQINDGLTQTGADASAVVYDKENGIVFATFLARCSV